MQLSRRLLLTSFAAVSTGALVPKIARAADYPERPIHLIVPFAAGGNADIVGRISGDVIAKGLDGTVVVENRAGAGGGIGAEYVTHATPDGYTLLVGSNGPLTVNPFVQAHLGYDPLQDLVAVALTSYVPHALIMGNKIEAKTVSDLVALSKKTSLNVATSGVGSASHMTLERLKAATGANFTHVPYRGGGALLPDLMGGSIDGAMTEFSTALPMHQGGKAHIIAIAAAHRSKLAPDIPTFDENGVKGFLAQSYIGILAPAKTPPDVIGKLQSAVEKGLSAGSPAVQRLVELGSEIATPEQMTSAGFAKFIQADYEAMRQAAQLAGIKPE
ncbi:MAG TPA: tripartite tricarboxylate transporter substrate binding protein [Xanthobacteraceae bacterium]|jgi:tripartite-type tricarboxylate transporter receptor subunit TctC|nr:tripartite tricarboxylate transporter substrate binding protein [Xanthobacteraceae bacterium]